jgi:hypothetical protein
MSFSTKFCQPVTINSTLNGYNIGAYKWQGIPVVLPDNVIEIGKYSDFHNSS